MDGADDLDLLEAGVAALEQQVGSRRAELDALCAARFVPPRAGFPWAGLALGAIAGFLGGLSLPIVAALLAGC